MRNVPLAIFATAFATFITFSGALVAMNHPSNVKGEAIGQATAPTDPLSAAPSDFH